VGAVPTDDAAPTPSGVVAVVLAAGGGSRYLGPTHKLLTPLDGATVVEHAVRAAVAGVGSVIVVSGAVPMPDAIGNDDRVQVIHHAGWADGQATSLAAAIATADRAGAEAVVVGLGDQPGVTAETWRRVAASRSPIAVATYDGRRRNPVRLHRSIWPLLPTTGDEGARSLIRLKPTLVEEVPCTGSPDDIDTLEDLLRWQSKSSTNSR
jgi:CTP:molybdopterin cytidylyltransferase MocA